MKVSVVGQGYVGLSVATTVAKHGHTVLGFDIDSKLVENLKQGKTYVPGIDKNLLLELINQKKYEPTNNSELLDGSEIIIIAVPTPLNKDRKPDLSFLDNAISTIAKFVHNEALLINESTSHPGTLRNFIKPKINSLSTIKFEFASAPERVDPGNLVWNITNTPRVVSGLTQEASDKAYSFYSTFCSSVHRTSSPEIAEASKLFENTFRQVNIALVNEFAMISKVLGFSASEAISAAATKPFGYMAFQPSIGVGGHCIPVDPIYLSEIAENSGFDPELIKKSNKLNFEMVKYVVDRIKNDLSTDLNGARIQVVGLTYKPNISDLRESPAIRLINELEDNGCIVNWYDPLVPDIDNKKLKNLDTEIDLGLIITPHEGIDFSPWIENKVRVFDLSSNVNNYGWPKFF